MPLAILLIVLFLASQARSEEPHVHGHQPQHAQLHEQFYQNWMRPTMRNKDGLRTTSCCNKLDCRPTEIVRDAGQWFAKWFDKRVAIPETLFEHNQPDPRDSPDGGSHACISAALVPLCALLGSGQ